MKARLYHDERVSERDADDSWSIYLPLPKKMRKKTGLKGVFLGCKPTVYGMIRCTWEEDKIERSVFLGKRIDTCTTPKAFQKMFKDIESTFQNACVQDTPQAWNTFYEI